jgi:hypothetical protein
MSKKTGYSANNPGNIREVGIKWKGRRPSENPFVIFETLPFGTRALLIQIRTYLKRGDNTLLKFFTKYAPRSENDTQSYIKTVSKITGIKPDEIIKPTISNLKKLAVAISKVETGTALTTTQVDEGARLLNFNLPSPTPKNLLIPILALLAATYFFVK